MRARILALVAFAAGALACSSTSSSSTAPTSNDAAADVALGREPKVHRPIAIACPTTREPGMPRTTGSADKCTKDEDCTAGKNGRCWGGLHPNLCTYDECAVDADCGTAVCDCRNVAAPGRPNVCFRGNCRTDADCAGGKGYCSPSAVSLGAGCTGIGIGTYGFFCHAPSDECIDDEECKEPLARCLFDPEVIHFRCLEATCPRDLG